MKTELEGRTKDFSVRIVRLIRTFPKTVDGIEMGRQLLRSGTSIGANYREANRAESKSDFIHKVGVAEKESSETVCWLEICEAAPLGDVNEVRTLLKEAQEILPSSQQLAEKPKAERCAQRGWWFSLAWPLRFGFRFPAFPLSAFDL